MVQKAVGHRQPINFNDIASEAPQASSALVDMKEFSEMHPNWAVTSFNGRVVTLWWVRACFISDRLTGTSRYFALPSSEMVHQESHRDYPLIA